MSVKVRLLRTKSDGTKVYGLKIDRNGKRKTVSVGSEVAAKKAKKIIDIEYATADLGITKDDAKTFNDVASEWLDFVKLRRSEKTYTRYKGLLRQYILKHIGNKDIGSITRGDIRDLLSVELRKGASRSSIELMHTVCSGVFGHALDDELITVVPTVSILKKMDIKRDKKEINPFTAEQISMLIDNVSMTYKLFFTTAYQTGARVGELCALEWQDVDFGGRVIRISKTASNQKIKKSTKTHVVRDVDISESLAEELSRHKAIDKKECFSKGMVQRFVFHHDGKLFSQNTLLRNVKRACVKLSFGDHSVHDIRHATASILLSRGVPLPYVSRLLGHSSPKITLDVYSHYLPSENKGAINALDEVKNVQYTVARRLK